MTYHRNFNNTLAIWTAFGGRGSIVLPIPTLNWSKKYITTSAIPSMAAKNRLMYMITELPKLQSIMPKPPICPTTTKLLKSGQ